VKISENHSTTVRLNGQDYLYFGGTNYLGLAHRPELMQAAATAFERYGFSTGASRLTSGENDLLVELEEELARFAGAQSAVVLPAGFLSNQAVVDAIDSLVDVWIVLGQAHGSIISALSHSKKQILVHDKDLDGKTLKEQYCLPEHFRLGVFAEPLAPLTGHIHDLSALCHGLSQSDILIVDEAHTFGVLGDNGKGALEHFRLNRFANKLIRTGTFSKALGSYGGFAAADEEVVLQIKQNSSCVKGSTSLSPPVCAAALEALRLIQSDKEGTIRKLKSNIEFLNAELSKMGFDEHSETCFPIYYVENSPQIARLKNELMDRGIYVPSVTSYFAGFCEIGLRWTIQAGHSREQLQRLLDQIAHYARSRV
jgi:7-keto-8-aminopelargonate synthetase-like enzyme